jgi:glycosyltransferase involved in cell wall biosynthesis
MWVVVAEPWFGGSHRAWAEGFAAASSNNVTVVGLPPLGWRWRLRAGAAPLAERIRRAVEERGTWPSVLVVSGLVDISSLLGHLRAPSDLVVIAYMHESQLVYPTVDGTVDDGAVLHNWNSWLVADEVWFNSTFHRDAVTDALPRWAAAQPEPIDHEVIERVVSRFRVLPVGVDRPAPGPTTTRSGRPTVLWPHRWEPDKAPDVFVRAVEKLAAAGLDFDLVLAGEDTARSPARTELLARHGDRVRSAGPFSRDDYEHWLGVSDIVVSCARHEFFGVAVVEAMMAGCVPVLPDDLSYPELLSPRVRSAALYQRGSFGSCLVDAVADLDGARAAVAGLPQELAVFEWPNVAPRYDRRIEELVGSRGVVLDGC